MAPSQPEVPSNFDPSKWFQPELTSVPEPARTLFAEYSKIPDEKIIEHIDEVVSMMLLALGKVDANMDYAIRGNVLLQWYVHSPYCLSKGYC